MRQVQRRTRIPGAAVAALLLLVVGVTTLAPAVSTYLEQRRTIAATTAKVAAQQADLTSLTAQQARWADPAYVRAQAGSRLFYVMPGTTAYRVIHADAAAAKTGAATPAPAAWTDVLAGSLTTAGTTTSAPSALETAG